MIVSMPVNWPGKTHLYFANFHTFLVTLTFCHLGFFVNQAYYFFNISITFLLHRRDKDDKQINKKTK